jgi:hypothetical protein
MKDAKGHGSDARGSNETSASRTNARQDKIWDTAKRLQAARNNPDHPLGALTAVTNRNVAAGGAIAGVGPRQPAMARLEASGKIPAGTLSTVAGLLGAGSHTEGVQKVGQPAPAPKYSMNSYTHEIVSPTGEVAARLKLGKNIGLGVDEGKGGGISRGFGPSIHDAVSMPDYRAKGGSFPAEQISGALHFLTGNAFAGHTVRRIKG